MLQALDKTFRLNDRFHVTHQIGKGGQATTYLARDEELQKNVAVKVLDFSSVEHWKSIDLFKREVATLLQLRHSGIPQCIEAFQGSDNNFYLIEDYIDGPSLRSLQKNGKVWAADELLKVLTDLLGILAYLHKHLPPIVHRDIKPANIILDPDGNHVLIDFGAVRLSDNETIGGSTMIGTPGYAPLEQLSGRAVPSSDLYALGATIVSLATGLNPTEIPTQRGKLQFENMVSLPQKMMDSLHRMLEPMVEDRVPSVHALISEG